MNTPQKPKTEPLDIEDDDVARFETDSELKDKEDEIYPGDTGRSGRAIRALR